MKRYAAAQNDLATDVAAVGPLSHGACGNPPTGLSLSVGPAAGCLPARPVPMRGAWPGAGGPRALERQPGSAASVALPRRRGRARSSHPPQTCRQACGAPACPHPPPAAVAGQDSVSLLTLSEETFPYSVSSGALVDLSYKGEGPSLRVDRSQPGEPQRCTFLSVPRVACSQPGAAQRGCFPSTFRGAGGLGWEWSGHAPHIAGCSPLLGAQARAPPVCLPTATPAPFRRHAVPAGFLQEQAAVRRPERRGAPSSARRCRCPAAAAQRRSAAYLPAWMPARVPAGQRCTAQHSLPTRLCRLARALLRHQMEKERN